jgi:hypothetical protein
LPQGYIPGNINHPCSQLSLFISGEAMRKTFIEEKPIKKFFVEMVCLALGILELIVLSLFLVLLKLFSNKKIGIRPKEK